MADLDSIFSSSSSEQRWVSHMRTTITKEQILIHDITPCVFIVPKTLRDEKSDAYAPQRVGIGPYHHLQPYLYKKQRQKLTALKRQLNPDQFSHFQSLFVDKFKQLEPAIRVCYDEYLDVDGDTLAWVVAIDGFFLFDLISRNSDIHLGDVMMLENQLPLFVLEEIHKGVRKSSLDDDVDFYNTLLRQFCAAHSPLKLNEENQFQRETHLHLLNYMYHLILNNRGTEDQQEPQPQLSKSSAKAKKRAKKKAKKKAGEKNLWDAVIHTVTIVITFVGDRSSKKVFTLIKKLPWDMIFGLLKKKEDTDSEMNSVVEEIEIPLVSSLYKMARVVFHPTPGGIKDIMYDKDNRKFYLPVITLNKYSEVIIRNLVAYEVEATPDSCSLVLTEYVELMCGLIDTAEDAKLLRGSGIIQGNLGDEEIASLFNGISIIRGKANIRFRSDLGKIIDEVNNHFDSLWNVKAYRLTDVFGKFITSVSTIMLVFFLILEAYCQVYGCSRFSGLFYWQVFKFFAFRVW